MKEEQVNQIAQGVFERIDMLAEKLGTTAEMLWPIFVQRVYYTGIFQICLGVAILVASIFSIKYYKKWIEYGKKNYYSLEGLLCAGIFGYLGLAAVIIALFYNGIINITIPQAKAFQDILLMINQSAWI